MHILRFLLVATCWSPGAHAGLDANGYAWPGRRLSREQVRLARALHPLELSGSQALSAFMLFVRPGNHGLRATADDAQILHVSLLQRNSTEDHLDFMVKLGHRIKNKYKWTERALFPIEATMNDRRGPSSSGFKLRTRASANTIEVRLIIEHGIGFTTQLVATADKDRGVFQTIEVPYDLNIRSGFGPLHHGPPRRLEFGGETPTLWFEDGCEGFLTHLAGRARAPG